MTLGARIRPMEPRDLVRAMAIAASLKDAPHWPIPIYQEALNPHSYPRRINLVAEWLDEVAGFAMTRIVGDVAELESIAVDEEFQRRGLGRRLLEAMLEELDGQGLTEVMLEVRASNLAARALYTALGFQEAGIRKGYYADPPEDAVLMSSRLEPLPPAA